MLVMWHTSYFSYWTEHGPKMSLPPCFKWTFLFCRYGGFSLGGSATQTLSRVQHVEDSIMAIRTRYSISQVQKSSKPSEKHLPVLLYVQFYLKYITELHFMSCMHIHFVLLSFYGMSFKQSTCFLSFYSCMCLYAFIWNTHGVFISLLGLLHRDLSTYFVLLCATLDGCKQINLVFWWFAVE